MFVTDHDMALDELYGGASQNARKFDTCMNTLAVRIATVFASLKVCSCSLLVHKSYTGMCLHNYFKKALKVSFFFLPFLSCVLMSFQFK